MSHWPTTATSTPENPKTDAPSQKTMTPPVLLAATLTTILALAHSSFAQHPASMKDHPAPIQWGNARYYDLAIGGEISFLGKDVRLTDVVNHICCLEIDGQAIRLPVARQSRPAILNGLRIFVSDTRPAANLTRNEAHPHVHGALTKDALICLSDPSQPLLDPQRFTFPIDRSDGYRWTMDEDSHMFAYLRPDRSHEGIDLDMSRARGRQIDALVAVEDSIVRWMAHGSENEACVLLQSIAAPDIYYIYQHLYRDRIQVEDGQELSKGDTIGYIWGDRRWGHLHFSVISHGTAPGYPQRYQNILNSFPQLYELWHGSMDTAATPVTSGSFRFATPYWINGNRQNLHAYSDAIGYGWRLGEWCPAAKIDTSLPAKQMTFGQSAVFSKTMHRQSGIPARSPYDWIDFEIRVENGEYRVKAEIGDLFGETKQQVSFEGQDAGSFSLPKGALAWTKENRVSVADGLLTIRLTLATPESSAGIRELYFIKSS